MTSGAMAKRQEPAGLVAWLAGKWVDWLGWLVGLAGWVGWVGGWAIKDGQVAKSILLRTGILTIFGHD